MKSPQDIKRACDNLRVKYADRDMYYENNYHAYRGEYNLIGNGYAPDPLTDVRRTQGDHIRVWNLIPSVVDIHRTLLNRLPQISVPSEVMGEEKADAAAEKREKAHYVVWDKAKMTRKHGEASFNLSLYNNTVWFVRWEPELDMPSIYVRQPGTCYPMFKRGGDALAYCIFRWEEDADALRENYPEAASLFGKEEAHTTNKLEVMEYVDADSYGVVIGSKFKSLTSEKVPKDTKLNFCPVVINPASFVPNDMFPPGPVHQLVSVNDYVNRFQTKWGDALELVMWPSNILQGEGSDNVVWNPAPGAINRLPEGVNFAQVPPPSLPTEVFVHIERMEQLMRRISGVSETAYGESPGSIVTGKAIGRLQGVMTGMAAETQANLAMSLQEVNQMCFRMWELYRPAKQYRLRSSAPGTSLSAPGRDKNPFSIDFTPEQDIGGLYDNTLYYSAFGSDFGTGMQMAMQMVSAEIASPQWVMDQVPGIGDSSGMMKEIEENKRRRMELETDLQTQAQLKIMAAQSQMQQQQMQQQAQAQGGGVPGEPPAPGMASGAPGDVAVEGTPGLQNTVVMPSGRPQVMGSGQPFTGEENFPLPFEQVNPYAEGLEAIKVAQGGAPAGAPAGPSAPSGLPGRPAVTVDEIMQALSAATNRKGEKAAGKFKGQVYLVGEIAARGQTSGKIEFALTVKSDQQIIVTALPQYASEGKLVFRVVTEIPEEAIPVGGGAPGGV